LIESTDQVSEVLSIHYTVLVLEVSITQDTSLIGNSLSGLKVVTTNHSHIDMSLLFNSIHNTLHICPKRILKSEGTDESELDALIIESLLKVLSLLLELSIPLVFLHLKVGEGDNSKWLGSHGVNFLSNFFSKIWAKLNHTVGALNERAHINDNLGGTFKINRDGTWFVWVLHNGGRSLLE